MNERAKRLKEIVDYAERTSGGIKPGAICQLDSSVDLSGLGGEHTFINAERISYVLFVSTDAAYLYRQK